MVKSVIYAFRHELAFVSNGVGKVVFQGASSLSLDGKGRLSVPTRHRDVLLATAQGQLTVTRHPHGCLMVFPRPEWEKFRERIAALPMSVIERARQILATHESAEHTVTEELSGAEPGPLQIQLFEPVNGTIAERIRNINIDELRPIEALQLLHELQRDLKK